MLTQQQQARLEELNAQIKAAHAEANQILKGRRCLVKRAYFHKKWHTKREGEIDFVHVDHRGIQPCVYILRMNGRGPPEHLNSDPDTRSCWPLANLEIL